MSPQLRAGSAGELDTVQVRAQSIIGHRAGAVKNQGHVMPLARLNLVGVQKSTVPVTFITRPVPTSDVQVPVLDVDAQSA